MSKPLIDPDVPMAELVREILVRLGALSKEEVERAFPGMTLGQLRRNVGELRGLVRRDLYVVIARLGATVAER